MSAPDPPEGDPCVRTTRKLVPRPPPPGGRPLDRGPRASATASPAASATPTDRTSRSTASSRPMGSRSSSRGSTTAADRPSPARSSSRPTRASTTRPSSRRWRRCSTRSPRSRTSLSVQSPYAARWRVPDLPTGRRARHDRLRHGEPPRGHRLHTGRRHRRRDPRARARVDGLRVELGGFLFAEFEQPSAELFGLAFAIVILIVAFGSVLAMGLPVGVALFGIGLGGAFVILASHLMEVPDFAPFIGMMIGLGVGIDYALLDRHPLSGAAARRARRARVDRHRHGHRRPLGGVRGRHRGDLAARACCSWASASSAASGSPPR